MTFFDGEDTGMPTEDTSMPTEGGDVEEATSEAPAEAAPEAPATEEPTTM